MVAYLVYTQYSIPSNDNYHSDVNKQHDENWNQKICEEPEKEDD